MIMMMMIMISSSNKGGGSSSSSSSSSSSRSNEIDDTAHIFFSWRYNPHWGFKECHPRCVGELDRWNGSQFI